MLLAARHDPSMPPDGARIQASGQGHEGSASQGCEALSSRTVVNVPSHKGAGGHPDRSKIRPPPLAFCGDIPLLVVPEEDEDSEEAACKPGESRCSDDDDADAVDSASVHTDLSEATSVHELAGDDFKSSAATRSSLHSPGTIAASTPSCHNVSEPTPPTETKNAQWLDVPFSPSSPLLDSHGNWKSFKRLVGNQMRSFRRHGSLLDQGGADGRRGSGRAFARETDLDAVVGTSDAPLPRARSVGQLLERLLQLGDGSPTSPISTTDPPSSPVRVTVV
jgi:hypothetical protein